MVEHPPIRSRLTTFALLESRESQEISMTADDSDRKKSMLNTLNDYLKSFSSAVSPAQSRRSFGGIHLVSCGCFAVAFEHCLWNAFCQTFKWVEFFLPASVQGLLLSLSLLCYFSFAWMFLRGFDDSYNTCEGGGGVVCEEGSGLGWKIGISLSGKRKDAIRYSNNKIKNYDMTWTIPLRERVVINPTNLIKPKTKTKQKHQNSISISIIILSFTGPSSYRNKRQQSKVFASYNLLPTDIVPLLILP